MASALRIEPSGSYKLADFALKWHNDTLAQDWDLLTLLHSFARLSGKRDADKCSPESVEIGCVEKHGTVPIRQVERVIDRFNLIRSLRAS